MGLSWSLDGKTLAYQWITQQEQAIYTIDVETGNSTKISEDKDSYSDLTWLSDSSLAFIARKKGEKVQPYQLYQIDADGQNLRVMSEISGIEALSTSLDGGQLAFVRNSDTSLYIKDIETGATKRFDIDFIAYQSYWSPDGKYLLLGSTGGFSIFEIETSETIYKRNAPPATWEQNSTAIEIPFSFYIMGLACLCCIVGLLGFVLLPLFSSLLERRVKRKKKALFESLQIPTHAPVDENSLRRENWYDDETL